MMFLHSAVTTKIECSVGRYRTLPLSEWLKFMFSDLIFGKTKRKVRVAGGGMVANTDTALTLSSRLSFDRACQYCEEAINQLL